MAERITNILHKRIESEISSYISSTVEISEGVSFSQYRTIQRINKFKNQSLSGSKINEDLSYNYYSDIISPRVDGEVKNLRFDTKHLLLFSRNPIKDFAVVFVSNAMLKSWMADNGEDEKLKDAVEEFVSNGNVGFKKVGDSYEITDATNTYITNQTAKTVNETGIIERHEMSPSELKAMAVWDNVDKVIKNLGNKSFRASTNTTPIDSTSNKYEVFEYTGEVSEKEFNQVKDLPGGSEHKYFLAKVIVAGLKSGGSGESYTLFANKLKGDMADYYSYAHRGRYKGRFWRVGMVEMLFDHQIRANEIVNDLARGLDWASRVIFQTTDSSVLQNIRADLENGEVIIAKDLKQIDLRMHNLDQLIGDWNRLLADADRLVNSFEIVRGESLPAGTPYRLGALLEQNAGKLFVLLRQKIALPYKRVFKEWVLPELVKELKGEEIFSLVGDTDILDQLREIMVESWYFKNLPKIGPHTKEIAEAIKAEKMDELRRVDPNIKNAKEIWDGVLPRMFITITGENSDLIDQVADIIELIGLEEDSVRISWMLDQIYRVKNIPVPPKQEPSEIQLVGEEAPEVSSKVKKAAPQPLED